MVDPTIINTPLGKAIEPLIKGIWSGSQSLSGVASTLSEQLGRSISIKDVVDTLKLHQRVGTAFADSALSMSETAVATAEAAANRATAGLVAEGAEMAAIEAAKKKAEEAVLKEAVKKIATQGAEKTIEAALRSVAAETAVVVTEAAPVVGGASEAGVLVRVASSVGQLVGFTGTAATVAGGIAIGTVLVGGTILIARLIGGFSADAPVQATWRGEARPGVEDAPSTRLEDNRVIVIPGVDDGPIGCCEWQYKKGEPNKTCTMVPQKTCERPQKALGTTWLAKGSCRIDTPPPGGCAR